MFRSKKTQLFLLLIMSVPQQLMAHKETTAVNESESQSVAVEKKSPQKRTPKKARFVKGDKNEHLVANSTNICTKKRWQQLTFENKQGEQETLSNTELFTQLPVQLEDEARHKGESSISLSTFSTESEPHVIVKLCNDVNIKYSSDEIKEQSLRLVLNQKGGVKIIAYKGPETKTLHKYLFSIEPTK